MTTSYFYSYIETTSYSTVFTITIRHRQSAYSLTGEWWESDDGKNWGKVTDTSGRDNQIYSCWNSGVCEGRVWDRCCLSTGCFGFSACAASYSVGPQSPTASQLSATLTANGRQVVRIGTPIILYFRANESVMASAGTTSYTITGGNTKCIQYWDGTCVKQYTEWGRTYQLQAIELVDWDTEEVYASQNQTSVTFNINANTIVRFKYVLNESWSRTWEVVLNPPPPSNPRDCQQILNSGLPGTWEWCSCAKLLNDPRYNDYCKGTCRAYFVVNFYPCCSEGRKYECLQSWSAPGVLHWTPPYDCDNPPAPQKITLNVQASWTPAPGWRYDDWGWNGDADCSLSVTGNSASGSCTAEIPPSKSALIVIIFKRS
jgi:hypothetical protein